MRIGYAIGGLGRGGAELQLQRLSQAMARRGHVVEVLAYDGPSSLDDAFRRQGVVVRTGEAATRREKIRTVRSWIGTYKPHVVHAVMKRASSLAVMARFPNRTPRLVATDMSTATYGRSKPVFWASLVAFSLADRVITQTELNRRHLERSGPWLRGKTEVIRNGLDTERFSPTQADRDPNAPFRFCVVGTVYPVKNPDRVVRAVTELRRRGRDRFVVDWYGRLALSEDADVDASHPTLALARELGVQDWIRFHGDTLQVEEAYRSSDALLHASVQEGFPNVVAEGMASGLPMLVSTVSDLPLVAETARNGFVFDECDVGAIADAMERMLDTPLDERRAMGKRSRDLAVRWFALDRFADEFESLYERLTGSA